ncbi:hypothetical protein RRG08_049161 [Elysia crispata]|uniref:Uncharacterized protein n=1 Tax=Elysia crispata TaxID=231223 RepID=A0AAE1ATG5_9GAST|nr:hypothetical protein RRG08_049161 [Elysia crispata]
MPVNRVSPLGGVFASPFVRLWRGFRELLGAISREIPQVVRCQGSAGQANVAQLFYCDLQLFYGNDKNHGCRCGANFHLNYFTEVICEVVHFTAITSGGYRALPPQKPSAKIVVSGPSDVIIRHEQRGPASTVTAPALSESDMRSRDLPPAIAHLLD